MRYTIRNLRPSVLHIPDAALRLTPGQTTVVGNLTSQMGALVAAQALEVVVADPIPPAPPVPTVPIQPTGEEKRGRKPSAAPTLPVTMEPAHDAN